MAEQDEVRSGTLELRVANTTNVHELATSMERNAKEGKDLTLACIGVQAVSQAAKSCAIANGKVGPSGFQFTMQPWFDMTQLPESEGSQVMVDRTVIKFTLLKIRAGRVI